MHPLPARIGSATVPDVGSSSSATFRTAAGCAWSAMRSISQIRSSCWWESRPVTNSAARTRDSSACRLTGSGDSPEPLPTPAGIGAPKRVACCRRAASSRISARISRKSRAASMGASGLWVAFSSCSATSRVSSSEIPARTQTLTVRQSSRLTASSRRRPQISSPSGVIVIGRSRPRCSMESMSGLRSPSSARWRIPMVIESRLRSSSMWP